MNTLVRSTAVGFVFLFLIGATAQAQVTGTITNLVPNGDEYVTGSNVLCKAWASGSGAAFIKLELTITGPGGYSHGPVSQIIEMSGNWSTEFGVTITTNNVAGTYTVTAKLYSGASTTGPFTLLDTHDHNFSTYVPGGEG